MNYALIENGVVTNVIWLYPGNAADFPTAVPMGDIPAAIGDSYADGVFTRDGQPVETPAQKAQDMQEALAVLGVEADG